MKTVITKRNESEKKAALKVIRPEANEMEELLAKVRTIFHRGTAEHQKTMKALIGECYAKTIGEKGAPAQTEEKKQQIETELLNDLHLARRKAIALTDVLEQAINSDSGLLEYSEGYSLVVIRDILEGMMTDVEAAGEGTWTPRP